MTALSRLNWTLPRRVAPTFGRRLETLLLTTLPQSVGLAGSSRVFHQEALVDAVLNAGLPIAPSTTPHAEARALLEAAAEIEHALLVEYLYAAYSVKPQHGLRGILIEVAIQEMAHFITVQNLLLFLGGTPHLDRQDISPNPDLDPFPFRLSGAAQAQTLERFILAEMPDLAMLPPDDQARLSDIRARLDPDGRFRRVGALYARLYWLFQDGPHPQGPWPEVASLAELDGFPKWQIGILGNESAASAETLQASRDEVGPRESGEQGEIWWQDYGSGVFRTISSRVDALAAIHAIAVQGESLSEQDPSAEPSHFQRFLDALKAGLPPPNQTLALAENPTLKTVAGATQITDAVAAALCALFDNRYQILMASLAAALGYSRIDAAENARRQLLVGWAFYEMRSSLRGLAGQIVRRPALAGGAPATLAAGPTFGWDDAIPSPADASALEEHLAELHARASRLLGDLRDLGVQSQILTSIEAEDQRRYP